MRHRPMCDAVVQTEASFVPSCISLKYTYDPLASEQYKALGDLRHMIERCMLEVGKSVFDVVALKDILIKMEDDLPSHFPATDLLLITSKLFRRNAELGRLLGVFFGVTFADDRVDEHFHFGEIRLLQRELRLLRRQLQESEHERASLHGTLNGFGQMALEHGKAVAHLETQNQALQLQTTALEDQMALLFHQLNTDLESYCTESFDKVTAEMDERGGVNATRMTFRQTINDITTQMRQSRAIIAELRTGFPLTSTSSPSSASAAAGESRNEQTTMAGPGKKTNNKSNIVVSSGGVSTTDVKTRLRLKTLDSNFQQLLTHFSDIKDVLLTATDEHMHALQERKKILYLAIQHIRLYDLQNAKLRQGKAIMNDLRMNAHDLLEKAQATFPNNMITSIDRFGRITNQRWQGGLTLAALRQNRQEGCTSVTDMASLASTGVRVAGITSGQPNSDAELAEAAMMAAQSELDALTADEKISEDLRKHDSGKSASYSDENNTNGSSSTHTVLSQQRNDSHTVVHSRGTENDALSKQLRSNSYIAVNRPNNRNSINNISTSTESSFPVLTGSAVSNSASRSESDAWQQQPGVAIINRASSHPASSVLVARPISASNQQSQQQPSLPRASLVIQQQSPPPQQQQANSSNNNTSSETDSGSFKSIQDLMQLVRGLDAGVVRLNETLNLEDDMAAFLKTLTLSIPSTARHAADAEDVLGRALLPTGASGSVSVPRAESGQAFDAYKVPNDEAKYTNMVDGTTSAALLHPSPPGSAQSAIEGGKSYVEEGTDGVVAASAHTGSIAAEQKTHSDVILSRQALQIQRQQERLEKMQSDFALKLNFLRQVYESRIADLEVKESALRRTAAAAATASHTTASSASPLPSRMHVEKDARRVLNNKHNPAAAEREAGRGGVANSDVTRPHTTSTDPQQQGHDERDELLTVRARWKHVKSDLQQEKKMRTTGMEHLVKMGSKTREKSAE